MDKYVEIPFEELKQKTIIIYGTGVFGRRCINMFHEHNIYPSFCSDSNSNKWGKDCCHLEILPPEQLNNDNDNLIVIAIEQFTDAYISLRQRGLCNVALYYCQKIYKPISVALFDKKAEKEIEQYLKSKEIVLWGDEKQVKDIQYIFDFLKDADCCEDFSFEDQTRSNNSFVIICKKYNDDISQEMLANRWIEGKNFAFVEDLLPLLDCENNIVGKIPSIMLMQTMFDDMKDQIACVQPFNKMQLCSDFSVHCCCGDWADSWGCLKYNSLEDIWNSSVAKIFRLSIINRTYSFCKKERCVHMKITPPTTTERLDNRFKTSRIPDYMEIGIDKTCNLFCRSCREYVIVENGRKKEQIEEISEKIKASGWLEKTKMLLLGGQGEVFVSPIYRSLMFDGASSRKALDLRTNGTAFTEDDLQKLVQKYEHIRIIVSIDASQEDTYNYLRRSNASDTYAKLQRNMKILSKMRAENKIDFLQINMCVQMRNYKEIPDFVSYGEELGCDLIYLTPIRNWGTYSPEEFKSIGIFERDKDVKQEVLDIIKGFKENTKVKIEF